MLFYDVYLLSLAVIVGIMTLHLIKLSSVAMLENTLKKSKPEFSDYIRRSNTFIPWFPNK